MNLGIIGAGDMGKWFAKLGKQFGWDVKISDKTQEKAQQVADDLNIEFAGNIEETVEEADIVLISVPIKETPKVIRETVNFLREDSLLTDIASIKESSVEAMKELETDSELVSIHPLFGPGAKGLENRKIVSVPVKPGERYENLTEKLSERGAEIVEMGAEKHDRIMSIIQNLTHFTLMTFLSALERMKYSEEAKSLTTPMFQKLLNLSKAFLKVNPELCGDIQTENKYAPIARHSFREASRSLDVALKEENISIIKDLFEDACEKAGMEEIDSAYKNIYEEE